MDGPDFAVGWWIFWFALGVGLFCALVWTFFRLAVRSDDQVWREYVERRAATAPPVDEAAPETAAEPVGEPERAPEAVDR